MNYSLGIDYLCPHVLPCECGSGSNIRGDGHSDYCQLYGEAVFDPKDASPLPKKRHHRQWILLGYDEFANFEEWVVKGVWNLLEPNSYPVPQTVRYPIKSDRK